MSCGLTMVRYARLPANSGSVEEFDIADDPFVHVLAGVLQGGELVEQNLVELGLNRPAAGEAAHPDAVGDEHVVERAVQRTEEGAAVGAIVGVGQGSRCFVDTLVGPAVIAGHHREMRFHLDFPTSAPGRAGVSPASSVCAGFAGGGRDARPPTQARSKRSRFITLVHAATKSLANFSFESAQA